MKKKLKLHRETLKNLTLDRLEAADGAGTHYATVCYACDTSEQPCIPSGGGGKEQGFA